MKKFTTKLLMSIIAVAFAFVALGTSTYAWFSMNTQVTVTGMEIGAKSENTYLLIGTGDNDTADEIQVGSPITVSLAPGENESTTVLPSKPVSASEVAAENGEVNFGSGVYFAHGDAEAVEDATTAADYANWYTAVSHNPAAAIAWSTDNPSADIKQLDANGVTFSDYVIKKTVYLTLADGSDNAHNLTVTPTIALKSGQGESVTDITAVRVLVATGDNYAILNSTMTTAQSLHTADFTITDTGVVAVDIYIYYDGSVSAVNTNNSANLAAATINLAFNVELGSAN